MDSGTRKKRTKARLKELGVSGRRQFVTLECKECKKSYSIRTNNKAIYTPEVTTKWVCALCKSQKGRSS